MNVSLTPQLEKFVRSRLKSGMYHSSSEVVREALRLLKERDEIYAKRLAELKAEVAKGTAVIIDVRGPDTYKSSHVKGALDYPLARLEQSDFKDLPQGKRIIAYCG